jgi:hypothetical protein
MPEPLDNHPQRHLPAMTEAQLHALARNIFTVMTSMNDLEATFTPVQKQIAEKARKGLLALNDNSQTLTSMVMQLTQLTRTLLNQRQSSKAAFMVGWNGFYHDLIAGLSWEDREMLLTLIDSVMEDRDDSEIPF